MFMDLLFQRYASPYLLVNQMIDSGRFSDFVSEFMGITNRETEDKTVWEYYLHHPFLEMSFDEFRKQLKISNHPQEGAKKANFETTVKNSFDMLNGFEPE